MPLPHVGRRILSLAEARYRTDRWDDDSSDRRQLPA